MNAKIKETPQYSEGHALHFSNLPQVWATTRHVTSCDVSQSRASNMNTAKRSPLPTDIDVKDHALAISQILIVFDYLRKSQHKFLDKKKSSAKSSIFGRNSHKNLILRHSTDCLKVIINKFLKIHLFLIHDCSRHGIRITKCFGTCRYGKINNSGVVPVTPLRTEPHYTTLPFIISSITAHVPSLLFLTISILRNSIINVRHKPVVTCTPSRCLFTLTWHRKRSTHHTAVWINGNWICRLNNL